MSIKMLTETLGLQLQAMKELHELLKQETDLMTGLKVDAMLEINTRKEEVSDRIQEHTKPLTQLIAEVAAAAGMPKATLGELAKIFAKQGNKEIAVLHEQLHSVAEQIREVAAVNQEIAERFAATLNQSLNFLTRVISQSNVYGATGYQQRQTGAVMINMEA